MSVPQNHGGVVEESLQTLLHTNCEVDNLQVPLSSAIDEFYLGLGDCSPAASIPRYSRTRVPGPQ
jgi:hypothetical protein